ncbi:11092_t:CDS:2 [Paraglomus occultum]|uniref:11092_t:CDS:1 n=1 Tax=Paraglomus occultum TaxID=144539 RepID=A0A9N8Z383_9GLOM|nr:11092_t:CDS:2 [Paraglomus occultum]
MSLLWSQCRFPSYKYVGLLPRSCSGKCPILTQNILTYKTNTKGARPVLRVCQQLRKPLQSKLIAVTFQTQRISCSKLSNEEIKLNVKQVSLRRNSRESSLTQAWSEMRKHVIAAFMPKGYPDSVTENYWGFTKWQFIHVVAGSITGVLSTQSLLYALGLGANSIPLAAALNWVIKDGLGHLGGVFYAAFISDRFDSEPKRHRLRSVLAMQAASLLELVTPLWPHMFLLIASLSNVGKNVAWLAGSATRAQMTKTFALRDNMGDITAKSGSQGTVAGLIGTGLGVAISAAITSAYANYSLLSPAEQLVPMLIAFAPFSFFNIYASYCSNLYVTTPTLNIPRAELIIHTVLRNLTASKELPNVKGVSLDNQIPTPKKISLKESFVGKYISPFDIPLLVEPSIHHYTSPMYAGELRDALDQTQFVRKEEYFILPHIGIQHSKFRKANVVLWFTDNASTRDFIKGFYHACVLRYFVTILFIAYNWTTKKR